MSEDFVEPDEVTYYTAVTAFEKGKQWPRVAAMRRSSETFSIAGLSAEQVKRISNCKFWGSSSEGLSSEEKLLLSIPSPL